MESPPPTPVVTSEPGAGVLRRSPLACAAFAVALVALSLAILPEAVLDPPATTVREELGNLARALWSGSKNPELEAYHERLRVFRAVALGSGIVAIALAIVAAVRREHKILAWSAVGLAAVAMLWQHLGAALVLVLVVLFLAILLVG
jgi:hypothetical protein